MRVIVRNGMVQKFQQKQRSAYHSCGIQCHVNGTRDQASFDHSPSLKYHGRLYSNVYSWKSEAPDRLQPY